MSHIIKVKLPDAFFPLVEKKTYLIVFPWVLSVSEPLVLINEKGLLLNVEVLPVKSLPYSSIDETSDFYSVEQPYGSVGQLTDSLFLRCPDFDTRQIVTMIYFKLND